MVVHFFNFMSTKTSLESKSTDLKNIQVSIPQKTQSEDQKGDNNQNDPLKSHSNDDDSLGVNKACIQCRKKHLKCDNIEGQPCSNCIRRSIECVKVERKRAKQYKKRSVVIKTPLKGKGGKGIIASIMPAPSSSSQRKVLLDIFQAKQKMTSKDGQVMLLKKSPLPVIVGIPKYNPRDGHLVSGPNIAKIPNIRPSPTNSK